MKRMSKQTMYIIVAVVLVGGGIYLLRDKLFGKKNEDKKAPLGVQNAPLPDTTPLNVKSAEYFHYRKDLEKELFRFRANFANFTDFKNQFVAAIKDIINSKGMTSKKIAFNNAKNLINLYLSDNPLLKGTLITLINELVISPLQSLITSKINSLFKADTVAKTKELIRNACDFSRKGQMLTYIAEKIINPVLDTILQDSKLRSAFNILATIGINIRTILLTIAEEKIRPYVKAAQDSLSPFLNTWSGRIKYPEGRIGDCSYDPDYAAMVNAPKIDLNLDDLLIEEIEDFRYSDL